MEPVVIATKNEELRLMVYNTLAKLGHFPSCVPSWPETLQAITAVDTRCVFVDADLCKDRAQLLKEVAASLQHKPTIHILQAGRTLLNQVPDLTETLGATPTVVRLPKESIALIPHLGWGPAGFEYLGRMANSQLPIRIYGERGTGKESVARMIHHLRGVSGTFQVVAPGQEPELAGKAVGTVYFQALDKHGLKTLLSMRSRAEMAGWSCVAGSRQLHSDERDGREWVHLKLRPLRECPKDFRPLTKLYLESYRRRLGIPRRRIHGKLWALMERYPWPGNRRELEAFVVQAITSARSTYITPNTLPPVAVDLLKTGYKTATATQSYELMVEERLRPVVDHYQPSEDTPSLYRMVLDATERALIRLVLNHNGGNQKSAASRLGLARNTLRSRMTRLDPYGDGPS